MGDNSIGRSIYAATGNLKYRYSIIKERGCCREKTHPGGEALAEKELPILRTLSDEECRNNKQDTGAKKDGLEVPEVK